MVSNISVWFVPTGVNGLPQSILLTFSVGISEKSVTVPFTFHPEFPKFSVKW